jgi:hypothetical protein
MKYIVLLLFTFAACAVPEQTSTDRVTPVDSTAVDAVPEKTNSEQTAPQPKVIERYVEPPDLTTYKNLTSLVMGISECGMPIADC